MCSIGMSDPSRTNTALLRSIIMEWVICRSLIEGMRQPFASEYDDFLVGVGAANAECQNERRESHHSIIPRSVASIMETVASANRRPQKRKHDKKLSVKAKTGAKSR